MAILVVKINIFQGPQMTPQNTKFPKKNLEYASSPTYQKIGVFGMLEVRKLCYTTGVIIICNLIPQRPVVVVVVVDVVVVAYPPKHKVGRRPEADPCGAARILRMDMLDL